MTRFFSLFRVGLLSAAVTLGVLPLRAPAQEMDHSKMNMPAAKPAPVKKKPAVKKAATKPVAKPAPARPVPAMDHSQHQMPMPTRKPVAKPLPRPAMKKTPAGKTPTAKPPGNQSGQMDHSAMGHDMGTMKPPARKPDSEASAKTPEAMDHSAMGHDMGATTQTPAEPMDHSAMGHDMPAAARSGQAEPMDHSTTTDMAKPQADGDATMQGVDHLAMGHDMSAMHGMSMAPTEPITPIPVVTEADRAAAVRPAQGHPAHDNSIQNYTLIDRLEVWDADPGTGLEWETQTWIGTDLDRLWLRSEGERIDGRTESADLEVLYGRSVAAWWDVVAGIRHDFKPGASQDFAAVGVIGLAPYKFEIEATAYIGESGQTAARFDVEYETLITNRLILQPLVEVNFYGKDDPRRGVGSGLSTVEAGLRLRYEFTRQFAPYVGIVHERALGGTADFRRAEGEDIDDTRLVAGLRIWF